MADAAADNRGLGVKFDKGKLRWTLLPLSAVARVVEVLEYGAVKYAPNSWQHVPGARQRYLDAAFRHLVAYAEGEKIDAESGLSHLSHVGCNILFLTWFDDNNKDNP